MSASSSPSRRMSGAKPGARGAVVIEATLTLLVFLLLVFSLFDFGYVLYFHHTLMQQARAANVRQQTLYDRASLFLREQTENPTVTNFVGASAMPSHAPAANPHATPTACSDSVDGFAFAVCGLMPGSPIARYRIPALRLVPRTERQ